MTTGAKCVWCQNGDEPQYGRHHIALGWYRDCLQEATDEERLRRQLEDEHDMARKRCES